MKYDCYTKKNVVSCSQCRFCEWNEYAESYVCKRPMDGFLRQTRYIEISYIRMRGTPLWCPLPDATDESMKEAA